MRQCRYLFLFKVSLTNFSIYQWMLPVAIITLVLGKQIVETSLKMESRNPEGEALTDPEQEETYFTYPSTGKEEFHLVTNSPAIEKLPHSANEKLSPLWILWNSLSQFLPFLHKSKPLFSVLQTCLWFSIVCLSCIAIHCYSWINSFCWWNVWLVFVCLFVYLF